MSRKKILIIGAGQAGLLLGIALLKANYKVILVSEKNSQQVRRGKILSNQAMFDMAISVERAHELNFWENDCPKNFSFTVSVVSADYKTQQLNWVGKPNKYYQSIDQRLKFSHWLNVFEELGGEFSQQEVTLDELNHLASYADLTLLATGKKTLSKVFSRDNNRSEFTKPQRVLSATYVKNMIPKGESEGVRINLIPNVGEYLLMTGLSEYGPCKMIQFEGIPGGPFDSWNPSFTPQEHLEHAKKLLKEYIPWEAELCKNISLTDENATLCGSFTPVIHKPIAKLPCGKSVLGLGDAVVLLDPLAGQGANNAAKAADVYFKRIIAHGEKEFTDEWMQETFDEFWERHAKWSTAWTSLLLKPPGPHILEYFAAASENIELADKLAEGFNDPRKLFPWITDPQMTREIIKESRQNINRKM